MARTSSKRVTGLDPMTVAMFQGVFAAVVGLAVAILRSLQNSVEFGQETDSFLAGVTFGVATGVVAIVVIPLVYFGIGWLLGLIQGYVVNAVLKGSGGLQVEVEE